VIQTIPAIALFGILMAPLGHWQTPCRSRGARHRGIAQHRRGGAVSLFAAADRREYGRGLTGAQAAVEPRAAGND